MNQQDYLKATCDYLPYGVEVQWLREDDNKLITSTLTISDYDFLIRKKKGKLLLTPLSEITKEDAVHLIELANSYYEDKNISLTYYEVSLDEILIGFKLKANYQLAIQLDKRGIRSIDLYVSKKDKGFIRGNIENHIAVYNWFFKNKVDVLDLIEKGYALDKTKLK